MNRFIQAPALNYQDPQVTEDAVRLLKSDFIALYVGLGYTAGAAGGGWHVIRTSKKGQELMNKLYPSNKPRSQALSFIDVKAEIEFRKENGGKANKSEDEEEAIEPLEEEKVTKPIKEKVKPIKNQNNMAKGEKSKRVLDLIEKGVQTTKELSEQAEVSMAYAKFLLEKNGYPQGKKRAAKETEPAAEA